MTIICASQAAVRMTCSALASAEGNLVSEKMRTANLQQEHDEAQAAFVALRSQVRMHVILMGVYLKATLQQPKQFSERHNPRCHTVMV